MVPTAGDGSRESVIWTVSNTRFRIAETNNAPRIVREALKRLDANAELAGPFRRDGIDPTEAERLLVRLVNKE